MAVLRMVLVSTLGFAACIAARADLPGDIAYITFAAGGAYQLELALWDLDYNTSTVLNTYPPDEYESGYVAGTTILSDQRTWILSLQYDSDPTKGLMIEYDLATNKTTNLFNDSFCFGIWEDAHDKTHDSLLCLSLVACPGKRGCSQETQLHRLSRSTGKDTLIADGIMKDFGPYQVNTYDPERGIIYAAFASLGSAADEAEHLVRYRPGFRTDGKVRGPTPRGPGRASRGNDAFASLPLPSSLRTEDGLRTYSFNNTLLAINATTGQVISTAKFEDQVAYLQLDWDTENNKMLSVVQVVYPTNGTASSYLSTVDGSTGQWTALPQSPDFYPYYGQLNTISTVSPSIHSFFFTAFHYLTPTDPVLYLIGMDTRTGALSYNSTVRNPFCDIEWHARA